MREYIKNGKPIIHSTDLYNFAICPKMGKLGREHEIELNDAMWRGMLLEGYALAFKDDREELELLGTKKNKNGEYPSARIELLESIKKEADLVKQFLPNKRISFKRIEVDCNDYFLTGEVDCFTPEIFYDTKRTKNFDYWNRKNTFLDFLQAFYYPYLWTKLGNPTPEFQYIVYSYELNLVKKYTIQHPEILFGRVEELISRFVNEPFFDGDISKCDNTGFGTCNYLEWCDDGKNLFTQESIVSVENLFL